MAGQMLIEASGGTPLLVGDVQMDYTRGAPDNLADPFHLPEECCDDQIALVSGYHRDLAVTVQDMSGDKNIVHTSTPGAPNERRIAVVRDSFGTALMDFLSGYFANVGFYHWQTFDRSLLEKNLPDTVIYLTAEQGPTQIPQDVGKMVPEE